MKMPELRFEPLIDTTEDGLDTWWMSNHPCHALVYLRYRYDCEKEWTYSIEYASQRDGTIMTWAGDWWEGQEHAEYLGVCDIDKGLYVEADIERSKDR